MKPLLAQLLDSASRAPSAHNTQPWRLRWCEVSVEILLQNERRLTAVDPTDSDALHALGALLENLVLTLEYCGFQAHYDCAKILSISEPIIHLTWQPSSTVASDDSLYRMIPLRRTSRLPYQNKPLSAEDIAALQAATAGPCQLQVITAAEVLTDLRHLVAQATAAQLANAAIAEELYRWLRFSPRERNWHRDGLNSACLAWKPWEASIAKLLLSPRVLNILTRFGLHRALCASVDAQAPPAPALCLLTLDNPSLANRIEAGRILQRIWLTAAARGLVTHPLSAALDVPAIRPLVLERLGLPSSQTHVNLFRIGMSAHPARSSRLPVDEIVEYADSIAVTPSL